MSDPAEQQASAARNGWVKRFWHRLRRGPALRMRLFLGMLVVTLAATGGFALAINAFIETLEKEMLMQTMNREMDGLVIDYRSGVSIAGPRGPSGAVFVTDDAATRAALPTPLARFSTQAHHHLKIRLNNKEYYAARRAIPGATIYLIVDVDPIARLEKRLARIGWTTLVSVLIVALLISLGCAYLILRPVRNLARRLSEIVPQRSAAPIADDYHDRDMQEIAASFDALVQRFRLFVGRERAFTADAGHELRTPLSVALSAHELLLTMDELPARARQRALRSYTACQRMNRTVTALLFLARDETPERWHCSPQALVRALEHEYQSLLDTHDNRLLLNVADVTLAAPPEAMNALLHNLVGHATSHTEHGNITLTIDAASICICYGSLGQLPTHLDDVFEREYQPEHGGRFGLGLYLVGRLCDRLGWRVRGHTADDGSASIHIECDAAADADSA